MSDDDRCAGTEITDTSEVLRRVAANLKSRDGKPSRASFIPTRSNFVPGSIDKGGLSTKRKTQSARDALDEYNDGRPIKAEAVLGVSVGDFQTAGELAGHDLPIYDDGGINGNPQHHASVWYPIDEALSPRQQKTAHEKIAQQVVKFATVLHPPE